MLNLDLSNSNPNLSTRSFLKRASTLCAVVGAIAALAGCSGGDRMTGFEPEEAVEVSIKELHVNPEKYLDKPIAVSGIASDFEAVNYKYEHPDYDGVHSHTVVDYYRYALNSPREDLSIELRCDLKSGWDRFDFHYPGDIKYFHKYGEEAVPIIFTDTNAEDQILVFGNLKAYKETPEIYIDYHSHVRLGQAEESGQ